jgi:hypothetical protein
MAAAPVSTSTRRIDGPGTVRSGRFMETLIAEADGSQQSRQSEHRRDFVVGLPRHDCFSSIHHKRIRHNLLAAIITATLVVTGAWFTDDLTEDSQGC